MAVVSKRTNPSPWLNDDGLSVFFGRSEGAVSITGELNTLGPVHCVSVTIDLDSLPTVASGDEQLQDDTLVIPQGALIEKVEILVTEETAGTNANLDIGLVKLDRSTELDFNGILTAGDDFNGGTDLGALYTYVKGTTDAGALVGAVTAFPGLITASAETADFTAGVIKVRVYYSIPGATDLAA